MAKKPTFSLRLPRSTSVESYQVQLADGSVVTRTVDQLVAAPAAAQG
ncbi:MAG: hypothetical protein LAO77_23135 [Acidobacteriia bacterium]|nr:hypothetical protein [Terriglobia bacterium]